MKTLENLALAIIAVFAPIKGLIIASFVLIVVDLVTGVLAARKRGEAITSAKLKNSVGKAFLYEVALLSAYVCEHFLIADAMPASKVVASLVGVTELKSILENISSITGENTFKTLIDTLVAKK